MIVDDTIVAVSSPPGAAPRGIVRLSGPDAVALAKVIFTTEHGHDLSSEPGNRRVSGQLKIEGQSLPATAWLFRTPKSYTRQDMVEIHMLGAPSLLGIVTESLLAAGARRAEPGEFTARAYLAGALDFSQVHGVAGVIAAQSDAQLRAASRLLHGSLSETALRARTEISDLLSLVEGALDFADEPIEFITPDELRKRLTLVHEKLTETEAAGLRSERWGELPRAVLIGKPNAGKSSLLNRLTGMDRAICAPVPGTTRDVIIAPIQLNESQCLLVDIAGLDAVDGEIDIRAQDLANRAIESADLAIMVIDAADPALCLDSNQVHTAARRSLSTLLEELQSRLRTDQPRLVVMNKVDLLSPTAVAELTRVIDTEVSMQVIKVSAETGAGSDRIKTQLEHAFHGRTLHSGDGAIALMAEHREALEQAIEATNRAISLVGTAGESLRAADLVAVELHAAAGALGALVGQEDTEDLLGRIFSRFCVGK